MYVTNLIAQEAHKLPTPLNFQTTHSEGYEIMYESDLQRISLRIDGTFLAQQDDDLLVVRQDAVSGGCTCGWFRVGECEYSPTYYQAGHSAAEHA